MLDFLLKPTNTLNLEKSKYRKLQNTLICFKPKFVIKVGSTLNNIYVTATNNLGKVIFVSSGGTSKIPSSKKEYELQFRTTIKYNVKKIN